MQVIVINIPCVLVTFQTQLSLPGLEMGEFAKFLVDLHADNFSFYEKTKKEAKFYTIYDNTV